MDAFGGESPLSEAPSSSKSEPSASPLKDEVESITKPPTKTKGKAATKSASASASASRRSSRVEERSTSPEKPSTATTTATATGTAPVKSGIKLKFTRPPSPEKVAIPPIQEEIVPEAKAEAEGVEQKDAKRGRKRKSEAGNGVEGGVREVMAKGKKAKISHGDGPAAETAAEGSQEPKKKSKTPHNDNPVAPASAAAAVEEPKKKGVAVKRIGNGAWESTDLMKGLFSDEDSEDEEIKGESGVKEPEVVAKPVIKIKSKPKAKEVHTAEAEKVDEDGRGEEVVAEGKPKLARSSNSKPRRLKEDHDDDSIDDEIVKLFKSVKGSSRSSRAKADPTDDIVTANDNTSSLPKIKSKKRKAAIGENTLPVDVEDEVMPEMAEDADKDYEIGYENKKGKTKGIKKKLASQETEKEKEKGKESRPTTSTKNPIVSEDPVRKVDNGDKDIEMEDQTKPAISISTTDPPVGMTAKPKKSFAQAVAGSPLPLPNTAVKKEKKPLPSITVFNKTNAAPGLQVGTPDKRSTSTSTGTGTNTPNISSIKKSLPPAVKKAAPSLLESTMASLLGGHTAPKVTPKKEETTQKGTKPTPVPAKKDRPKGSWADTWEMTPSQQREFMESKAEREEERRKRLLYRNNPVNLQEAKDSYRLDSTKSRIIPALAGVDGGLGIRTKGAPSRMLQALIDRNTQTQSQPPTQAA